MNILHLSDLHFGTLADATNWHSQLADDLINELDCSHLDVLIISGDIANKSTPEEYVAAEKFLRFLCEEFRLGTQRIVIVPGNHDLNWSLAEDAYMPERRQEYNGPVKEDGNPDERYAIDKGEFVEVQVPTKYKLRFRHFSLFYQTIKGTPYPLEYEQQAILHHFPEQGLLILGLNSAWHLDHHYKSRAGICPDALSNALTEVRQSSEIYGQCLKVAVWHHPLNSPENDCITDTSFLQRLSQAGFCLALHGHIHKAETSLYRYDMSVAGRRIEIICAGTFGAPTLQWVRGYPLQYNLLKLEGSRLVVETRCRRQPNGAWTPDAMWTQGPGQDPLPRYEVGLPKSEILEAVSTYRAEERAQVIQRGTESFARAESAIPYKHSMGVSVEKVVLFGYFFVTVNGMERILVCPECESSDADSNIETVPMIYKLPLVHEFDPTLTSIEEATNQAVRKAFDLMAIEDEDFQATGFSRPFYQKIYDFEMEDRYRRRIERKAIVKPFIFLKIEVQKEFDCGKKGEWVEKREAIKQWKLRGIAHYPPTLTTNLFEIILSYRLSNDYGYYLVECVDILIFRVDDGGIVRFLMFYRRDTPVTSGWEYPKGRLFYHETELEGALRKIGEETGIRESNVRFCCRLGWQTPDVEGHRKEYDTLRVHGLVFEYLGDLADIRTDKLHRDIRWMTFEEAKENMWMPEDYPKEFFDRWKEREEEILSGAQALTTTH